MTGHMDSAEAAGDNQAIDVERAQAAIRELERVGRESWTFVRRAVRYLVELRANREGRGDSIRCRAT